MKEMGESPRKRKRGDGTKRVIDIINQAVTLEQRLAAIGAAQEQFDHNDEDVHDLEVSQGAARALCLQLGYVLNKRSNNRELTGDICCTLEFVYRCSDDTRALSFQDIGSELLPLLLESIERCQSPEDGDNPTEKYYGITLVYAMKIIHSFSRTETASTKMVTYSALLTTLVTVMMGRKVVDNAKMEAAGTLKSISFHAEENRYQMAKHPNLLNSLVHICHDANLNKTREHIAGTLWNLSTASQDTKNLLVKHGTVINALIKLAEDANQNTKRCALSCIGGLAIGFENIVRLLNHFEGVLINVLLKFVKSDPDPPTRRRAIITLRSLGAGTEHAVLLAEHDTFLATISSAALHDADAVVRVDAAETLASLASDINAPLKCHPSILDALVEVMYSETMPCVEAVTRALMKQALVTKNQVPMMAIGTAFRLVESLANVASNDVSNPSLMENATGALFNLSCAEENREKMAEAGMVLTALVKVAQFSRSELRNARDFAVGTLVQMATASANKLKMARHQGLVSSLIRFASICTDASTKDVVKQCIIDLVPEM